MPGLWQTLSEHTLSHSVYLANYAPFQMAVLDLPMRLQKYELVTFRRAMVRVGEKLAERLGYDALVLGDSLGQVASQTMENISAVDRAVEIPIFRPLIGMDKVEVVDLVRGIGLEEAAAAPYKDCCSIIARHPATRAHLDRVQEIEERIDIERIVEEMAATVERVPARAGVVLPEDGADGPSRPPRTTPKFIVDEL
jgi:thiamine biosynthesis protein ThiI